MTDDKPTNTISLAAERGKRERDFAAERDLLTRELADIGVPPEKASEIVADLLLIDWWFHGDPRPLGPGAERGGRRRACENHGEEGLEMEMMLPRRAFRQLLQRFLQQRHAAKQRGIAWQLDYWQWLEIWQTSGHLQERGRRKGEFQMCRPGDVGPYASSNVRIDRETNVAEAQITKRRLRLERQASLYGGAPAPRPLSAQAEAGSRCG